MLPLAIQDLVKCYGNVKAVQGVTFHIEPGEIFGLLGPNGAGKTSIISILTTLEEPTSGHAKIFGTEVKRGERTTKTELGVVPQEIVSHGFFSVEEVLRFHSGYYGIRNNEKQIAFLLERLGLSEHRHKRVRQLSGGMKRRLLIAKALVHRPKLLLLDEPTAGVDIELRNSLWEFVRDLNREGMAILLTTHYLEEAEELCSRVGILHQGKLLKVDRTKDLVRMLTARKVTFLLSEPLPKIDSKYVSEQTDAAVIFRLPNDVSLGSVLEKIPTRSIRDISIHEGSLEEAFLQLVEESRG